MCSHVLSIVCGGGVVHPLCAHRCIRLVVVAIGVQGASPSWVQSGVVRIGLSLVGKQCVTLRQRQSGPDGRAVTAARARHGELVRCSRARH